MFASSTSLSLFLVRKHHYFCQGWIEGVARLILSHDSISFLCYDWHLAKHLAQTSLLQMLNVVPFLPCVGWKGGVSAGVLPSCVLYQSILYRWKVLSCLSQWVWFVCNYELVWKMCANISNDKGIPIVYVCIKIMKMAGPHGLSGPTVQSPVDVEGIKGDDPAMASSHPVLARRSKPAAAWWQSVTARVGHHSACLICHALI